MLHTIFNIFLFMFIIFILLLGVTELIKQIIQKAYKSKSESKAILIFPLPETDQSIEYELRSIVSKVRWAGNFMPRKVICLDCGLCESDRKACEIICSEYEFIELMSKEETYDYLEKINQR